MMVGQQHGHFAALGEGRNHPTIPAPISAAAGDKIPRKGGPGITKSDLLVINKTDLAPMVGASLDVMDRDSKKMRGERPFVFTNLKSGDGLARIVAFIEHQGLMKE